jgi:hypothetical protein
MQYLILFTITFFIGGIDTTGQNALGNSVSKKDTVLLKAFVKRWDIYFDSDWTLDKANSEEIDHFENGYVLTWTRLINNVKYLRTYVFGLNSQFVRSHEQRFIKDTLLSQGPVEFKNKAIHHITQVIINKRSLKKLNLYWNYDVDGYFYEIYENGKLSCIYKTIHLNHYYMLFEKANKDKIDLVTGKDCLGIKTE